MGVDLDLWRAERYWSLALAGLRPLRGHPLGPDCSSRAQEASTCSKEQGRIVIKYRYDLLHDPEPGPHVRRLLSWGPSYAILGKERWERLPCRRQVGDIFYSLRSNQTYRRSARRCFTRWHGERREEHWHWFNGDKSRPWGPLRGDTVAVDLDALRRMRASYPRGWRKRR